jgi:hypothetical protein
VVTNTPALAATGGWFGTRIHSTVPGAGYEQWNVMVYYVNDSRQRSEDEMLNVNQPSINDPTISRRIRQLLESMDLAEMRLAILRGHMFGEGESSVRRSESTTVEHQLSELGERLASFCGDLATVNARIGCTPEAKELPDDTQMDPSAQHSMPSKVVSSAGCRER